MKQLLFILFIPFLSFAQCNWVKNGNFKETEYSYLRPSKIKRLDIEFASPKHWIGITEALIPSIASNVKLDSMAFRSEWDQFLTKEIISKLDSPVILTRLGWMKKTKKNPFSRTYLIGHLHCPLKENQQYSIKIKIAILYHQDYLCLGQDSLGIYFGNELEIDFFNHHDFSPRYSSNTANIALPISVNEWEEISTIFTARGGENKLMIGCFVEEEDLNLFRKIKNKKRHCSEATAQVINICWVSLTPLDPNEECACQEQELDPLQQQEFQKE